jgi:hypothetical protein
MTVDLTTGEVSGSGDLSEPGCTFTYEITTAGGVSSAEFVSNTVVFSP